MLNERYPRLRLPLSATELGVLPRHPAYLYRLVDGRTDLTPRPGLAHALLEFDQSFPQPDASLEFTPFEDGDWPALTNLFRDAFESTLPFAVLPASSREALVQECMRRTQTGEDGPLVPQASLEMRRNDGRLIGACLVTLTPAGPLDDFGDSRWLEATPDRPVESGWGRPHVTWIMVGPAFGRTGLATQLLRASVTELARLGYRELSSTLLTDNLPSLLWHWKVGFQLVAQPGLPD